MVKTKSTYGIVYFPYGTSPSICPESVLIDDVYQCSIDHVVVCVRPFNLISSTGKVKASFQIGVVRVGIFALGIPRSNSKNLAKFVDCGRVRMWKRGWAMWVVGKKLFDCFVQCDIAILRTVNMDARMSLHWSPFQ